MLLGVEGLSKTYRLGRASGFGAAREIAGPAAGKNTRPSSWSPDGKVLAIGTLGTLMVIGSGSLFVVFVMPIVFLFAFAIIRDAWVAPWIIDHIVTSVTITNPSSLNDIASGALDSMTRGEGLADSFDVGIV